MSIEALLIESYNTDLMSNADVRTLVSSVSQDPQTESVDFKSSRSSVRAAYSKLQDKQTARRQIIGWLNKVYFSNTTEEKSISYTWWWEMNTRLSKLLIVAMILEGDNLRGFGAVPEPMDIPQCLVGIMCTLTTYRETVFDTLRNQYQKKVEACDPDYINLYIKNE